MRDIKFKAWNPKKSMFDKLHSVVHGVACRLHECDISEPVHHIGGVRFYSDWDHAVPEPDWILIQYTGLKDKNGVDIYEGDILTVMINDTKMMDSDDSDEYFAPLMPTKSRKIYIGKRVPSLWTVEYVDHLTYTGVKVYGLNRRFNKPLTNSVIYNSCAEVAGNIYENPELLEACK